MDRKQSELPDASILFIINTEIKEVIKDAIETAAGHYGMKSVRLFQIDKEYAHPTKQGMEQISEQIFGRV